jgi:hypothetical protein
MTPGNYKVQHSDCLQRLNIQNKFTEKSMKIGQLFLKLAGGTQTYNPHHTTPHHTVIP